MSIAAIRKLRTRATTTTDGQPNDESGESSSGNIADPPTITKRRGFGIGPQLRLRFLIWSEEVPDQIVDEISPRPSEASSHNVELRQFFGIDTDGEYGLGHASRVSGSLMIKR